MSKFDSDLTMPKDAGSETPRQASRARRSANDDAKTGRMTPAEVRKNSKKAANDGTPPRTPPVKCALPVKGKAWEVDGAPAKKIIEICDRYLEQTNNAKMRTLHEHLTSIARSNGLLDTIRGVPSMAALAAKTEMSIHSFQRHNAVRQLLDEVTPLFWANNVAPKVIRRDRVSHETRLMKVKAYLRSCAANDVALQITRRDFLDWREFAKQCGVAYEKLVRDRICRRVIEDAIKSGEIKLQKTQAPCVFEPREKTAARIEELLRTVHDLGFVPESVKHQGAIDYDRIAKLTPEPGPTLQGNRRYRRALAALVRSLGLGTIARENSLGSLNELLDFGRAFLNSEAVRAGKSKPNFSPFKTVLFKLMTEAGLELEDASSQLFDANTFEKAVGRMLDKFPNPRTGATYRWVANWWRERWLETLGADNLPADFGECLELLLKRRGLNPTRLAREAGEGTPGFAAITSWITGKSIPSRGSIEGIRVYEKIFQVPTGTLEKRLQRVRLTGQANQGCETYNALDRVERGLLPDDASTYGEEELARARAAVRHLLPGATPFGKLVSLSHDPDYRWPEVELPQSLLDELERFIDFKVAQVPYPFRRHPRARWGNRENGRFFKKNCLAFFAFCAAPRGDGPAAGLGLDPASLTLGMLAIPSLVLAYIVSRARKYASLKIEGKGPHTAYDFHFVNQCRSMTNPIYGWLAQQPAFANKLPVIEHGLAFDTKDSLVGDLTSALGGGLLPHALVEAAKSDYGGFIAAQHAVFEQARNALNQSTSLSRDPFLGMEGLVEAAHPMAELLKLLVAARSRRADQRTSEVSWAIDVRDDLMLLLAAMTAFRPKNLVNLTWSVEGAHVQNRDGVWQLEIPYVQFKNWRNASIFGTWSAPRNYRNILADELGLHSLLDEWFGKARDVLRTSESGDAAFLGVKGRPMTVPAWGTVVRRFATHHIAHNPLRGTGIAGVNRFNPYAFRHIRATDILRNGKSSDRLEEAARALQTSRDMVKRNYGMITPLEATESSMSSFTEAAKLAAKMRN